EPSFELSGGFLGSRLLLWPRVVWDLFAGRFFVRIGEILQKNAAVLSPGASRSLVRHEEVPLRHIGLPCFRKRGPGGVYTNVRDEGRASEWLGYSLLDNRTSHQNDRIRSQSEFQIGYHRLLSQDLQSRWKTWGGWEEIGKWHGGTKGGQQERGLSPGHRP